jgi:hypothetical protein
MIMAKTKRVSYSEAITKVCDSIILANNLPELDPTIYDDLANKIDSDRPVDIFQWFITDCSESDIEYANKTFPELLFAHSEALDLYILCVPFYGMSWDDYKVTEIQD